MKTGFVGKLWPSSILLFLEKPVCFKILTFTILYLSPMFKWKRFSIETTTAGGKKFPAAGAIVDVIILL